jgi:dTDP-4-dehydrorhamnose reductase
MKAIITGANGTVGRAMTAYLTSQGGQAIAWNRSQTPIDQYQPMFDFVRTHQPDTIFHFAIPSVGTTRDNEGWWVHQHWTSELAWICRELNIRFVFSSTVMVYTNAAKGPFTVETRPDATEGYGYDKLSAEQRAIAQNPATIVARLGWQIGSQPHGNNMLDFFRRNMEAHGEVTASRHWLPACSFVIDTASALVTLAEAADPGVYLVSSNREWTFYQLAVALSQQNGGVWKIRPTDDFVYDQRMIDDRVVIPRLETRLPELLKG